LQRIDDPELLATMGTRHIMTTNKIKSTMQKTKKMSNAGFTKKWELTRARKG